MAARKPSPGEALERAGKLCLGVAIELGPIHAAFVQQILTIEDPAECAMALHSWAADALRGSQAARKRLH